ncbi:hypothetical protein [Plantactinospora sp. KLBMP9567]|uniref:hypothetical protein n=1 Tax=Plantactinospora sp. KLBMP9567 TaxID=3085900 RepID=UPI002981B50E|nr:hypothetical protein [Plantactinospora sp. KLBMP9567]MDW5323730.1 hypothetical protein [Plantactinospora sp. KLBMP9567]MDW5326850.1 hypothetical protein [Plantactinospora sp. KLBMP9567]
MAVAVLLLAGCGSAGSQDLPALQFEEAIDTAIAGVAKNGEPVLVRDLTSVEWDEVALFSEGATKPEIENVVGESGLKGNRYLSSPNLLVFRDAGEVVSLVGTTPDLFTGEYGVLLGPEAFLTPDEARGGYVWLTDGTRRQPRSPAASC